MDDDTTSEQRIALLEERVFYLESAVRGLVNSIDTATNVLKMLTERVTGREIDIPHLRSGTG
jgi:hypothetical protein